MRLRLFRRLVAWLFGAESAHPDAALEAIALSIEEEWRR